MELSYDPAILLLGIYSELRAGTWKILYTDVHSSIIHNSQNVEATQVPVNRRIAKESVIYIYKEIQT